MKWRTMFANRLVEFNRLGTGLDADRIRQAEFLLNGWTGEQVPVQRRP